MQKLGFATWFGEGRTSCSCPRCSSGKTAAHSGDKTEKRREKKVFHCIRNIIWTSSAETAQRASAGAHQSRGRLLAPPPRGFTRYLAALLQLLLHLLGRLVDVDGQVRRQELADADALDLVVVLHTCERWKYTSGERRRISFVCLFKGLPNLEKCGFRASARHFIS